MLITEIFDSTGPTGKFRQALIVAVQDYGGNELGRVTTKRGLYRVLRRYTSTPTRLHVVLEGDEVTPTPDDEVVS